MTYLHTGARSTPSFNKITDDITLGDCRGGRKGSRIDCVLEETEPGTVRMKRLPREPAKLS